MRGLVYIDESGAKVTLSTSAADKVDVWDNNSPSDSDTPILGGGTSSVSWTVGTDTIPTTLWVGATQASTIVGDIGFTLAASVGATTLPSATTQGTAVKIIIQTLNAPNEGQNGDDWAGQTEDWLVGQMVDLEAGVQAPVAWLNAMNLFPFTWSVDGNVLYSYGLQLGAGSDFGDYSSVGTVGLQPDYFDGSTFSGTADSEIRFFWVATSSSGAVPEHVKLTVDNIGGHRCSTETTFNVETPIVDLHAQGNGNPGVGIPIGAGLTLALMANANGGDAITISASVTMPEGFTSSGTWAFLQMVCDGSSYLAGGHTYADPQYGAWLLDTELPAIPVYYSYGTSIMNPIFTTGSSIYTFKDNPWLNVRARLVDKAGNPVTSTVSQCMNGGDFLTYVMFLPPGNRSQWLPVKVVNWYFLDIARWDTTVTPHNWYISGATGDVTVTVEDRILGEPTWNSVWKSPEYFVDTGT